MPIPHHLTGESSLCAGYRSGQQQTRQTKLLPSWNLYSHGEDDSKQQNKRVNNINSGDHEWYREKKKQGMRWCLRHRRVGEGVNFRWGGRYLKISWVIKTHYTLSLVPGTHCVLNISMCNHHRIPADTIVTRILTSSWRRSSVRAQTVAN